MVDAFSFALFFYQGPGFSQRIRVLLIFHESFITLRKFSPFRKRNYHVMSHFEQSTTYYSSVAAAAAAGATTF